MRMSAAKLQLYNAVKRARLEMDESDSNDPDKVALFLGLPVKKVAEMMKLARDEMTLSSAESPRYLSKNDKHRGQRSRMTWGEMAYVEDDANAIPHDTESQLQDLFRTEAMHQLSSTSYGYTDTEGIEALAAATQAEDEGTIRLADVEGNSNVPSIPKERFNMRNGKSIVKCSWIPKTQEVNLLRDEFAVLTEKEATVMKLRYGLYENTPPMKLNEIGIHHFPVMLFSRHHFFSIDICKYIYYV